MASRSSSRWLHVLCLVILQNSRISAEEPAPNNGTHWDNFTTGSEQVYVTNEGTNETLSTTLETIRVNVTSELDLFNITNSETSRSPDITLETSWSNFTARPDQVFITSKETPDITLEISPSNVTFISQDTSGTPNSTFESYLNNSPTGPDLSHISEETTTVPNTSIQSDPEHVTSESHLTNVVEETTRSPNTSLQSELEHVTSESHLTVIEETTRSPNTSLQSELEHVTSESHLTVIEETSGIPNTSIQSEPEHVTSESHLTVIEETSGIPNTSIQSEPEHVTSESHQTNVIEETSGIPNTSLPSEPESVTSESHLTYGSDLGYITKETSTTLNNTPENYPSNVTSGPHWTHITPYTSGTSTSTLEAFPNNATRPDVSYTSEETSRTPNNILDSFSNITSGSDLTYIRTTNSTLEQLQSNVTTDPGLVYLIEETTGTSTTSQETGKTSYPDVINPLEPIDSVTATPATWTPNSTLPTGGTPFISTLHCFQDADCPPFTACTEQGTLHVCQCHLGHFFHQDLGCVAARTFPARIPISMLYWDGILVNTSVRGIVGDEIRHMEAAQYHLGVHRVRMLFQDILDHVPGYVSTSVTDVQLDDGHVTIVHFFSTLYPVTEEDVCRALTVSPLLLADPHDGCLSPLTSDNYQGLSLCDFEVCDASSSDCLSVGGLVTCECRQGYYKVGPTDRSCTACGSGYQRTASGCDRCPIGFGGFNCDESYLLAVIVESCVGCGLVVSLITLLVFYFRRKKPQKPMFMDSIVLGIPATQPSIRLPRAQFSWRREWEWNEPPQKVLTDIHQEAASPDGAAIHMKTFGDPARFSAPSSYHGRHNLSFISD
ncbi:uncharacterized protein LOC142243985 [Anomaloglossus baeobatrachus]|uniref:uncharacterized protein LOC142243985 n=1 Tax=Anomaloglossus baeobatrachus TaxID=238106 RepID=UPI003F509A95